MFVANCRAYFSAVHCWCSQQRAKHSARKSLKMSSEIHMAFTVMCGAHIALQHVSGPLSSFVEYAGLG